jgi:hypothetical protein
MIAVRVSNICETQCMHMIAACVFSLEVGTDCLLFTVSATVDLKRRIGSAF